MSRNTCLVLIFVVHFCASPSNADELLEEVIVSAHPLSAEGIAQSSVTLDGEDLNRAAASSIGATLSGSPGIHSASFGEAASRPIIHGLGGARVRVMEDRIDTMDASVTSADHVTTVEAFVADGIEVLKGASTLLYGSGAIGGVVDVHTGRIPHRADTNALSGRFEARIADNAQRRVVAGRIDGGNKNLRWHTDGFWRNANSYEIPGEPDQVAGSQLDGKGGAVGVSTLGDWGFAGLAVSGMEAEYGLPGAAEEADELQRPTLAMQQRRIDLEFGSKRLPELFDKANLRIGINDYEHQEIEPTGELGTSVKNKAWEARGEISHRAVSGWLGAFGLQLGHREFSALGEEAFLPPVVSDTQGVFWVAEKPLTRFDLEVGARIEHLQHKTQSGGTRNYYAWSTALGIIYPVTTALTFSAQLDVASRAPVAEELFSNGPHLATQSYELGEQNLDNELVRSLALNLVYENAKSMVQIAAYFYDFDQFIYQADTGSITDGLRELQWQQADTTFAGFDLSAERQVTSTRYGTVSVGMLFDTVSTKINSPQKHNLPRIPPTRLGYSVKLTGDLWSADLTHMFVQKQSNVAPIETPTDRYSDLSANISYQFMRGDSSWQAFLQIRNLTDELQLNHSSFVKEYAPLPGRTIEAGIRVKF